MKTKIIWLTVIFIALAGVIFLLNSSGDRQSGQSPSVNNNQSENTNNLQAEKSKSYTTEEVLAHASENDCWTIVEDKVYDVTVFIPSHPGGKAIIAACGKNGTELFSQRKGKGPHPDKSRVKLDQYLIGTLKK